MRANFKSIITLIVIFAVIIFAVSWFTDNFKDEEKFEYSDLIELFDKDLVTSFNVDGDLAIKIVSYKALRDEGGKLKDPIEYELNEDGSKKTEEHTYTLSYNFQLQQINLVCSTLGDLLGVLIEGIALHHGVHERQ